MKVHVCGISSVSGVSCVYVCVPCVHVYDRESRMVRKDHVDHLECHDKNQT